MLHETFDRLAIDCDIVCAAATAGHDAVLAALLEAGARPDQQEAHGETALMRAAAQGHAAAVAALLEAGATIDLQSRLGVTALFEAAVNAHPTVNRKNLVRVVLWSC